MFQYIYIAVFSPQIQTDTVNKHKTHQTVTAAPHEFSANTVRLRWRANIPQTWGSLSWFKPSVAFPLCRLSFDASAPAVTVKAEPSLVLKATQKSFHTDTCQIHRCTSRMPASSTAGVTSSAFSHTLKTHFNVSDAANVIWNVLKYLVSVCTLVLLPVHEKMYQFNH